MFMAVIYSIATVRFRADQVVIGIAINLMAIGATRFFLRLAFDSAANSPRVRTTSVTDSSTSYLIRNRTATLKWSSSAAVTPRSTGR